MSDSLRPHGLYSIWYSPGQNTGVGSFSLLQGIFPTQGSNLGLLLWPSGSLLLTPPVVRIESESPWVTSDFCDPMDYTVYGILQARILEWVAFPFSSGSSQPRDQTRISCIAGGFFTNWATREALIFIFFRHSQKGKTLSSFSFSYFSPFVSNQNQKSNVRSSYFIHHKFYCSASFVHQLQTF